jgi:hypothetical protein
MGIHKRLVRFKLSKILKPHYSFVYTLYTGHTQKYQLFKVWKYTSRKFLLTAYFIPGNSKDLTTYCPVVALCTTGPNIQKFSLLSTACSCVLCGSQKTLNHFTIAY